MKIETTVEGKHALLKLSGEFDTFHVAKLSEEISSLIGKKIYHAILNLRLVEFMNSTALGAILKAQKSMKEKGGDLVVARPSVFCKEILARVGLDRLIRVFPTDEAAAQHLTTMYTAKGGSPDLKVPDSGFPPELEDESSLLLAFVDPAKFDAIAGHAVGKMTDIGEKTLDFVWGGGKTGLKGEKLLKIFSQGTELRLKFRIPLFKKGFFEVPASVSTATLREDGAAKIATKLGQMSAADQKAIQQFVQDRDYLKAELKKATKKS